MEKIIKTSYHVDMEIYAATGNQHKKEELSQLEQVQVHFIGR